MRILKQSLSAEKSERGTFLNFLAFILLQNIKKLEGGPFGDIKNFSIKVSQFRKKNRKGNPLVTSGFVGYVKKVTKAAYAVRSWLRFPSF